MSPIEEGTVKQPDQHCNRALAILKRLFVLPLFTIPLCIAGMIAVMVWAFALGHASEPIANAAYAISAYLLAATCATITCKATPSHLIAHLREHRTTARLVDEAAFRARISSYGGLALDTLWGVLNLGTGIMTASAWLITLGVYYICLAIMRVFLVRRVLWPGIATDPTARCLPART